MSLYSDSLEAIGGLSAPAKMPCHSWSIPASTCKLGSLLRASRPDSVCGSCYAHKGMYVMPNVQRAMARRFEILSEALRGDGADFVEAFGIVLRHRHDATVRRLHRGQAVRRDGRYFRWHDSGDLQGVDHLELVNRIALQTPDVLHWVPTREVGFARAFLARHGMAQPNLRIRLSAMAVNEPPPMDTGMGSAVNTNGVRVAGSIQCEAYTRNGECGPCRACWYPSDRIVSYPLH